MLARSVGQDEVVIRTIDEFLGVVKQPAETMEVGRTRIEVAPARFLRGARFEERPTAWSGWRIYHTDAWSSSEDTVHYPEKTIFVRTDGSVTAHLPETRGLLSSTNTDLPEHHQVDRDPDAARTIYGAMTLWVSRIADAKAGLPFNLHVHNSVYPELHAGRWASDTAVPLLAHVDFEEMVQADATASANWFVQRLAAFLDDPVAGRDFWGHRT